MADIIAGVFPNRDEAEAAVRELRDRGFTDSCIGIAARQVHPQARAAGATQATISQPFGWVPDHCVLPLSGQSDIFIAGLIADCHRREGGNQDSVAGLLCCLGVNPEHARWYDQQVCEGKTLVTVLTERPVRQVEAIMCQFGSIAVPSRNRTPSSQPEAALSQPAESANQNPTTQFSATTVRSSSRESTSAVKIAELQSVEPGWEIVGTNGQKVGKVDEIGGDYLMTKKGFIFTHDVFIPFNAVAEILPNQVKLNVPAHQVGQENWSQPPLAVSQQPSSTKYATTAPTNVSSSTVPVGQPALNQVKPGYDVFTRDGNKIGTVQEASAECLHVLQCSNLFVPANRVERVDNDRITLNVEQAQMRSVDWSTCHPAHRATYAAGGPGYSGLPPQEHSDGVTIPIETVGNDQSNPK
ncbi:MAG TPA: DUF2171 domain-containing protein [Chloroflexota bacterium]|nr:DUF2171 domain-containing protein [Chloroflexota bacterium]